MNRNEVVMQYKSYITAKTIKILKRHNLLVPDLTEDFIQDAYLKILEIWDYYKPEYSPLPFISTVLEQYFALQRSRYTGRKMKAELVPINNLQFAVADDYTAIEFESCLKPREKKLYHALKRFKKCAAFDYLNKQHGFSLGEFQLTFKMLKRKFAECQ
jgi:hypothetical protein